MTLPSLALVGAVFLASELTLGFAKRSRTRGKDRFTILLLYLAVAIGITLAFIAKARWPAGRLPHPLAFYIAGLTIFLLGLIVRWMAIFHLGRYFTVNVAIAQDHQLITTGPYRYVRHPSYSGSFLLFLGFGLCFLNVFSLLGLLLPVTAAFLWRIEVEEAALQGAFGENYRAYAARTRRIIPGLY